MAIFLFWAFHTAGAVQFPPRIWISFHHMQPVATCRTVQPLKAQLGKGLPRRVPISRVVLWFRESREFQGPFVQLTCTCCIGSVKICGNAASVQHAFWQFKCSFGHRLLVKRMVECRPGGLLALAMPTDCSDLVPSTSTATNISYHVNNFQTAQHS